MKGMKNRSKWIIGIFVLAFLAILFLAVRAYFSEYSTFSSANLDQFIRGFGPLAIVVYILAYLLGSPIPFLAPILMATGGLLFGPVEGTAVAILSATATSLLPFMVARKLGRGWVKERLKGSRMEDLLERANRGGFVFILLLRLVPVMPWEVQNYVAGVTHVRVPVYLAATLLGSTPLSVALVILGYTAKHPGSWQFFAALAMTAVILVTPPLIVWLRSMHPHKPKDGESTLEKGSSES